MTSRRFDYNQKLPFTTRPLEVQGGVVEQYIIPDDMKEEVLQQLYIFTPVPALDEERYDLHEGKLFKVKDFMVVWDNGHNFLVSPYFGSSGGSVIDWMPASWANPGADDEEDLDESEEPSEGLK
jgi:hypothetical protein